VTSGRLELVCVIGVKADFIEQWHRPVGERQKYSQSQQINILWQNLQ
jgi:hypothetical protein